MRSFGKDLRAPKVTALGQCGVEVRVSRRESKRLRQGEKGRDGGCLGGILEERKEGLGACCIGGSVVHADAVVVWF